MVKCTYFKSGLSTSFGFELHTEHMSLCDKPSVFPGTLGFAHLLRLACLI